MTEHWVIKAQETHVSVAFEQDKQEKLVVDQISHHNVFEGSNFTDRFVSLVVVRGRPCWWPAQIAALADHQGMIAEVHWEDSFPWLGFGLPVLPSRQDKLKRLLDDQLTRTLDGPY